MLYAQQDGGQQEEARFLDSELVDGATRGSQEAVQLVDRAVGCNAQPVLEDALAPHQSGLAAIALSGIDAVDGEAGLVEGVFSHGQLWDERVRASLGCKRRSLMPLTAPSQWSISGRRRSSVSAKDIRTLPHIGG